jgi:copper chaperone
MIRTIRLAAAALAALALSAPAARAAEPSRPAAVKAADAVVSIPVGGMSCGGCVNTITGKLQAISGVKAVDVNLEKRRAVVTYDASGVDAKALVDAIREAGFEPGVPVVNRARDP